MDKSTENLPSQPSSSRSSSRRTSGTIPRESLPTPLPEPHPSTNAGENVFKYPPEKEEPPLIFHSLLDYAEQADEVYKTLHKSISEDCKKMQAATAAAVGSTPATAVAKEATHSSKAAATTPAGEEHKCASCQTLHDECKQLMDPLHQRLGLSVGAVLSTYGAVEQLNRLYAIWDQYLELDNKLQRQKECLRYTNLLHEKLLKSQMSKATNANMSDTETELDQSIALLDFILADEKRSSLKQPRERSKSVMVDDGSAFAKERERELKAFNTVPHLLRRQSTYSEGKSKVSKWTKVKAAFKWERANVPAMSDGSRDGGLTPVNHEVARYLCVPTAPYVTGSSADSILSSSSGHVLSETGTPGTISSASSMDDLDSGCRNTLRRDSTKSDNRSDSRITDDGEPTTPSPLLASMTRECSKADMNAGVAVEPQRISRTDCSKASAIPFMSSTNKSLRKCKVVSDFETLPEDVIANIKSTPARKIKPPLSPLNLNLRQDLSDLESFYSPHTLKSPKDGTQSLHRSKKISSPGNSSVPSSPSRHSDFFAEFESEDLSSGDFSEPTSPSLRKAFRQKQEIKQHYQELRAKLVEEFEDKRRGWEKLKSTSNACRTLSLISPIKSEEHSPNQAYSANLSAKLLEENLTPDFKKKLRKWRVKKQISLSGGIPLHGPTSPSKDANCDAKMTKIDWNLWKTGQLKLEGQGLSPLPDQKDLPEEFQKKLEQWNKIKRGGSLAHANDSVKRSAKHGRADSLKKPTEDDRGAVEKEKRVEKHKPHDKDKSEKLAKLKSIVTDHPAKEIEVKTAEGVMKFEGISRKFTRKLYEWEKARGIGPESSTFALLHPGYCPIDVGRISKESHNKENSPTLSRSLSLDSIAPNMTLPVISQQASSLSLNDVNEFKDMEGVSSCDALEDTEYKKYEEPEAVMVEVEDHIVETASPLITAHTYVEQQTPVYKYEEKACSDFCNTKRVQSFESHTNLAPLLSALNRTDELFALLKQACPEMVANEELRQCGIVLSLIRQIYPYYTENLVKANVLNAISDVQVELSRIGDLHKKAPLDEACCSEILEERGHLYNEELRGLHDCLQLLKQRIHGGSVHRYPRDIVPDISITSDADHELPINATCDTATSKEHKERSPTKMLEATVAPTPSGTHRDNCEAAPQAVPRTINMTFSNSNGTYSNNSVLAGVGKKKRLRKMGSRQNSKTESDSSDGDSHGALETPRRLKRKNYRLKQRSLDEDYRRLEYDDLGQATASDGLYVLKVRPGHPIQQFGNACDAKRSSTRTLSTRTESCPNELGTLGPVAVPPKSSESPINANANVFVKTKRKIFTTIEEPNANEGIAVIAHDVEQLLDPSACGHENTRLKATPNVPAAEREKESADKTETCTAIQISKTILNAQLEATGRPRRVPCLSRSLSLFDVRKMANEDERKCQSVENIRRGFERQKQQGVRPPLASDSFRVINKIKADARNAQRPALLSVDGAGAEKRREHRFRKNSDSKPYVSKSVGATVKKIETMIAKTNSSSAMDKTTYLPPQSPPDKMDNTLPRISRKLERKSLTPTTQQSYFDYPLPLAMSASASVNSSEPTTPLYELSSAPRTPLSERAQRLLRAKENFLQSTEHVSLPHDTQPSCRRRDEFVRSENWAQYRCSDNSLSSATTIGEDGSLLKSLSADTIIAETPTQSDAGTDADVGNYDSLPRAVSRSGKLSSKLGFATLASKFRRVKVKKGKEAATGSSSSSALSELCRQSLRVDVLSAPQILATAERTEESVMKSQSSPQAAYDGRDINSVRHEVDRLNKSQSEQYVKRQKESLV